MDEIETVKNHMNTLIKKIKYHEHMFHVVGTKTVEDSIYDSWRKELENLEESFPELINKISPSLYIGEKPTGIKICRKVPMLSLRHSYNKSEIERFCESFMQEEFIIEPKVDGVALSIEYEGGKIKSISLRGDGREGEDISHMSQFIHDLPFFAGNCFEVRGEAYVPKTIHCENRRNFTAGYLRKKDPQPSHIHFVAYRLIEDGQVSTQSQCIEKMRDLGFVVVPYEKSCYKKVLQIAEEYWTRDFPFEIDGAVIKINNLQLNLGNTARYSRDAIAYKFSSTGVQTTVKDIQWGATKVGILVPTCVLDPIDFDGTCVSRCHGHNKKNLEIKKIGIGAVVSVVRIGNIIPYIEQVIENGETYRLTHCPFCEEKVLETELNYVCPNLQCCGVKKTRFIYFFEQLKVTGLGEKLILRFFIDQDDIWQNILRTVKDLKSSDWIKNKNDEKVFQRFLAQRRRITFDDLVIASSVEGIATKSQLEKTRETPGKRKDALYCFLTCHERILDEILCELINP